MRNRPIKEAEEGICDCCGEACCPVLVDCGIGSYEFWGAKGTHHDWQALSPCCEAEVVEGGVSVIRRAIHTAKKEHNGGKIKPGDRYLLIVKRHWRRDGPSWITTKKIKQGS